MDKKPTVFPTSGTNPTDAEIEKQKRFEAEKQAAINEVYNNAASPQDTPTGHVDAVELMRQKTEAQIREKKERGTVVEPLAAPPLTRNEMEILEIRRKAEDQMRVRDELLARNTQQIQTYQQNMENVSTRTTNTINTNQTSVPQSPIYQSAYQPKPQPEAYGEVPSSINSYILELSQPNYNSAFDVIPLPSEGKLYRNKKSNVRLSFMTTADENILTSPNLVESGQFLEILINRKLLEGDLRYKDLHIGDRNAIMLWLRATGYGEIYPITLVDDNGQTFDTDINLNEMKVKNLGAEPDGEGLFPYVLPMSKLNIKFRFLTCGDIDDIENLVNEEKKKGVPVDNSNIYKLQKCLVEIQGDRDRKKINMFAASMRLNDSKELLKYMDSIESGVDLNITVGTPGGGSLTTFLPLNLNFFWPNLGL